MRDTGLLVQVVFPASPERSEFDRCDREPDESGGWHVWGLNLNPDVEVAAVAVPSDVSARDWKGSDHVTTG